MIAVSWCLFTAGPFTSSPLQTCGTSNGIGSGHRPIFQALIRLIAQFISTSSNDNVLASSMTSRGRRRADPPTLVLQGVLPLQGPMQYHVAETIPNYCRTSTINDVPVRSTFDASARQSSPNMFIMRDDKTKSQHCLLCNVQYCLFCPLCGYVGRNVLGFQVPLFLQGGLSECW